MDDQCIRVLIEFKRIQTFLFAVPRLRTILGANALIGEALRLGLPRLACTHGCAWPRGIEIPDVIRVVQPDNKDPLASSSGDWCRDTPSVGYEKGVLTRDGGHFQALFADRKAAQCFATAAARMIENDLPGLTYDIRVEEWTPHVNDSTLAAGWKHVVPDEKESAPGKEAGLQALYEPPGTRVCEWSGQGAAVCQVEHADEKAWVSLAVCRQFEHGTRFREDKTDDIVGLMKRATNSGGDFLLPCFGNGWEDPDDFTEIVGGKGGYLALIHVDGNGVGKRKPDPKELPLKEGSQSAADALKGWLDSETQVEAFFYTMRSQVRASLVEALGKTYADTRPSSDGKGKRKRPYQLLMVGGDDVLLLCRAQDALPFVNHYACALRNRPLSDGRPLDVGAGVVIARPTFPFHAMHALAEELAASAKRLARGQSGRSVVDWMVVTSSTMQDLDEHRRLHDLVRYRVGKEPSAQTETLVLSAKPYFVIEDSSATEPRPSKADTLAGLLELARQLRDAQTRAARSQRKALPDRLRVGRLAGQDAVEQWLDDLPQALRKQLKDCGLGQAWDEVNGVHMTRLVDLVEVTEIPDLGRRRAEQPARKGATT